MSGLTAKSRRVAVLPLKKGNTTPAKQPLGAAYGVCSAALHSNYSIHVCEDVHATIAIKLEFVASSQST